MPLNGELWGHGLQYIARGNRESEVVNYTTHMEITVRATASVRCTEIVR